MESPERKCSPEIEEFRQKSKLRQEALRRIIEKGTESSEATEKVASSLDEREIRTMKNYAKAYAYKNQRLDTLKEIDEAIIIADTQIPNLSKGEMTVSFFKQKYPLLEE